MIDNETQFFSKVHLLFGYNYPIQTVLHAQWMINASNISFQMLPNISLPSDTD